MTPVLFQGWSTFLTPGGSNPAWKDEPGSGQPLTGAPAEFPEPVPEGSSPKSHPEVSPQLVGGSSALFPGHPSWDGVNG